MRLAKNAGAFHGGQALKSDLLEELVAHRKADQIIAGTYCDLDSGRFRGCGVGCAVDSLNGRRGLNISYSDHSGLSLALGIPESVINIFEVIFEMLPKRSRASWPERFFGAISPGADLSMAHVDMMIAVNERNLKRSDSSLWPRQRAAIERVIEVLREWRGGKLNKSAAIAAYDEASAAAESASSPPSMWTLWTAFCYAAAESVGASFLEDCKHFPARAISWAASCNDWHWTKERVLKIVASGSVI